MTIVSSAAIESSYGLFDSFYMDNGGIYMDNGGKPLVDLLRHGEAPVTG